MATGIRKYHIAINGKGFMLKDAPSAPRYVKEDAPTMVNQLGVGDVSYAKLNGAGWLYWAQTDWSGGFQQIRWKDNATFKDGQAVDVLSKYGDVKLQNKFTSAVSISGSHTYGAHSVHDSALLLGTVKSGAAKLFSISTANSLSTISAMAGISAVNVLEKFNGDTLVGMTRTSGTIKTMSKYNGSTLSGFRNSNPIVRAIKAMGIRVYSAEKVASLSGDVLYYATNLSAFTSAYQAGKNRNITHIMDLYGNPYFLIKEGDKVDFVRYDEYADRPYPIYHWENLTSYGITKYPSQIIIAGSSNGKKVAYSFNGARLAQIFDDQLLDSSYDFSKPFVYKDNLQVKGAQYDGSVWVPGLYGKYATVQYTPFGNFNNKAYGYAVTGTRMILGYVDTSNYEISGHVISSEFGHQIGGIDKLVNAATVNCDALATGQTIELLRSIDGGSNWTSVGTLKRSTDGAIKAKTLYFTSGIVTKLWNAKAVLVGPGTSTPTLKDISFEYRPVPELKKRWSLTIDANKEIYLLNKQQEERDSKALMSELWLEKEAKRTVTFEDVDAFESTIMSAITSASTTAIVNSIAWMPPKGRMRVRKSGTNEEMTYTSADGNVIKGISRGQKGTLARAYTAGDKIDNFYTVVVAGIREQVDSTDQNVTQSLASVTLLEV